MMVQGSPIVYGRVDLHKIMFYFYSFVHESVVLSFSWPTCFAHTVAILFHGYRVNP